MFDYLPIIICLENICSVFGQFLLLRIFVILGFAVVMNVINWTHWTDNNERFCCYQWGHNYLFVTSNAHLAAQYQWNRLADGSRWSQLPRKLGGAYKCKSKCQWIHWYVFTRLILSVGCTKVLGFSLTHSRLVNNNY